MIQLNMRIIHGIYKITNKVDNKIYVGSAAGKTGITERWYKHKTTLKHNKHCNSLLQRAYNKHGSENFQYDIIEECLPALCIEREQFYLDLLRSYDRKIGYNLCIKAGNTLGRGHSKETRLKIGKNRIYGESPNKGKKATQEQKDRMSMAQKLSIKCQNNLSILNKSKRIPVIGIHTKTGEILKLSYAGADPRFIDSGIQQCCKGKFKTYKGYKWSYDT